MDRRTALKALGSLGGLLLGCGGAAAGRASRPPKGRSPSLAAGELSGRLRAAMAAHVEQGDVPGIVASHALISSTS